MSIWRRPLTPESFAAAHVGTLPELLGIRLTEVGADFARAEMPVDARHIQPFGILHGGASVVLAETLGSTCGTATLPPGQRCVGVEINASHLRPIAADGTAKVVAQARPIRLGRTLQVWEIALSRGVGGEPSCLTRLTLAVLPTA